MASKYKYIIAVSLLSLVFFILIVMAMTSPKATQHLQSPSSPGSQQIAIEVLDIGERSYKNKPALAILFSTPLDSTVRYDKYIEVQQYSKSGWKPTQGGFVLAANHRTLFYTNTEPQTKYKITINRGLIAANQSKIKKITEKTLTTRKITPSASFASKGSILPGKISAGLPIVSVNVAEVDIEFMRIEADKITEFLALFKRYNNQSYYTLNKLSTFSKSVYKNRFTTQAKANQRTITHIPIKAITELQKPGIYVAVLTRPGHFNYYNYQTTHYIVTDIGLHSRVYSDNFQVHARSLKTSDALADLKISIYDTSGKVIDSQYTDEHGVAKFKFRPPHHSSIIAQRANDFSILSFRDPALDLSEFNTKGINQHKIETFVYSNRDLFRPGEKIDFSILLRNHDGKYTNRLPLHLTIKRPDGKVMSKRTMTAHSKGAEDLGYYHYNYQIPNQAQTGKWVLEVKSNPSSKQPNYAFRFNVEEFLPERMKLELESALTTLKYDTPFIVQVVGSYLYGAPAAKNRITAVLNRYPKFNSVSALPGYHFGNIKDSKEKTRDTIVDDKLDDKGKFSLKIDPLKTRYNTPMAMYITTSLFETGGRPVNRSIERVIWPAEKLIGIRPTFTGKHADPNTNVSFDIVKADYQGKLYQAKDLELKVIREQRDYYWDHNPNGGWQYKYTESHYPIHVQTFSIDTNGKTSVNFPVEYGAYRIEVKDPDTNLTSAYRFYAGWNWLEKTQVGSSRPDKVSLVLDKKAYKSGDKINIELTSPHNGRAIIFIESNNLLAQKEINVTKKTTANISFDVKPEWAERHDIYVTSVVYRVNNNNQKLYSPSRSIGIAYLPMDRQSRKLDISLDLPKKMQPGRTLKTKVKISNLKNQQAIVTLSAVDHGILNITDFETPDPNKYFFAKRAYNIEQYDHYGKIIESQQGPIARLRYGGDAPGIKQNKRDKAEVKTVALFSGPVELNDKGEAEIELPIPDFNGSLRVMAVAFSQDRYGSAEQNLVVAAPIIAEIAMPRFISPGDKSSLVLDLHNLSGTDQDLKVTLHTNSMLRLSKTETNYQLKNKEKQSHQFELYGNKAKGVGKITLTVAGNQVQFKRSWELTVRPAYPIERRSIFKVIKPNEGYTIKPEIIKQLMPQTVDGTLTLSSQPPLDIRNAITGLLQYPYGCLEQTTSRAFPLVYVDEQKANNFSIRPMSLEKRAELIQQALTRLRSMQKASGGFGLWSSSSVEEPWLTPYVIDFMQEAKNAGFYVPEDMLQKGLQNLKLRLGSKRQFLTRHFYTQSIRHLLFASNAYSAYVLAKTGHAPLGTLRTLYDNYRKDAESSLPLVQLGIALKLQGDHDRGNGAIELAMTKTQADNFYLGDYGSAVRDRGLSYALLARHNMLTDKADKLIYELANMLKSKSYLSTQDRLAIFLAAHHLSNKKLDNWQANLVHNNKTFTIDSNNGRLIKSFTYSDIKSGIQLKSKSTGKLYLKFQVNGYGTSAPKPRNDKIEIVRQLYDISGKLITRKKFQVGELLVAHLSISSKHRTDNAMVVDLLPAGFEIENLNISKGEKLDNLVIAGKKPYGIMNQKSITHSEYRDDRFVAVMKIDSWQTQDLFYLIRVVSPGEYFTPPPFIEDMYNPEWHGIGKTPEKLKVVNVSE